MIGSEKKVALVTGSATGVGRACAVKFASHGFDVVVNYPGADKDEADKTVGLVAEQGSQALIAQCDVSLNEEVVAMIADIEMAFGRLDVVVNAAGLTHFVPHEDLDGLSEAEWDATFAVNTKGPFLLPEPPFDCFSREKQPQWSTCLRWPGYPDPVLP